MTKTNILKIEGYLNDKLSSFAPGGFKFYRHKTTPKGIYGTFDILNENQSNDNVMERDLVAFTFYCPEIKGPYANLELIDEFRNVFYGANKDINGFMTRSIDQLGRLDEILPKGLYRTTITVNITYAT